MNVVITGASGGIGLAFVQQYIHRGDKVFAICRKANAELAQLDVTIIDKMDITKSANISQIVQQLKGIHIDILINNAGLLNNESLDSLINDPLSARNEINSQFQVNALAPLLLSSSLITQMDSHSKIIFITSRMGSIEDNTSGGYYGYRMSKAALNAGAKSLAVDLEPRKIAVGIFHPGYVITKMTQFTGDMTPEESVSGLIRQIDTLTLENSAHFYHSNGEKLPW